MIGYNSCEAETRAPDFFFVDEAHTSGQAFSLNTSSATKMYYSGSGCVRVEAHCLPPSLFLMRKNGSSIKRKLSQEMIMTLANQITKITNPRIEKAFIGRR